MGLIVQKYGGTSVGSTERIRNVARRVARFHREGHQLVVVPSAMSGETNRLLALAKDLSPNPDPRELDVVAATGEQVTIGLLAIALHHLGIKAKSYTGGQVRILTDSAFTKARILKIDEERIRADLAEGTVVIVAGFQGVDGEGNITTLGRGGSDTSGVAPGIEGTSDPLGGVRGQVQGQVTRAVVIRGSRQHVKRHVDYVRGRRHHGTGHHIGHCI